MTHEAPRRVSLSVLPGTINRLRMPLATVACWRLGDGVFRFDHKLIGPEAKAGFAEFWATRDRHPSAPLALFGHADIKGDEEHNHRLGAERALAVYGVLNANPNLWFELFAHDRPGLANLHALLRDYGLPHGDDGYGPATFEAVARYMEHLGGGRRLEPYDYLDDGRHSMQSCSELNPVVRPSRTLVDRLSSSDRARLEAVNRRVVAYFFEPGTYVGDRWPCPNAGAGIEACYERLWSNAAERRATPKKALQYWPPEFHGRPHEPFVASRSTFACRFYERIAGGRGCEKVDPWRPPEPDPPEPPPPPEDDVVDVDPVVVDPPAEWTLHLVCEHPDHANRRWIYVSGKDVLQVVPPPGHDDLVSMKTDPEESVDWSLPDGTSTSGYTAVWTVPAVIAVDPKPWDLLEWKPTKYLVEATKDLREQMCTIEAYPSAQYSFDFETVRAKLRKMWAPALVAWDFVGNFLLEDFELELLEEGACGGHLKVQWREHPGPDGGAQDYRAYLGYWFSFYATPMVRCRATMSISLEKILGRLRKIPKARALLDFIPEKAIKRLEFVSIEGTIEVEGGGRHDIRVDEPGRAIPSIGTEEPGASEVELDGKFVWKAGGSIDLDSLVTGEEGSSWGSFSVSFDAELDVTMGLIVDIEGRRMGAYLEGDFRGVEISCAIELPGGIDGPDFTSDRLGEARIERASIDFDF